MNRDTFEELRTVATRQNEEGEFPTWLMADIMDIADGPERYADKVHLVEALITQISNFDPYAGAGCFDTSVGAGCFDTSVGAETIGATIRQILACRHNGYGEV